jgi:hypothetical protein
LEKKPRLGTTIDNNWLHKFVSPPMQPQFLRIVPITLLIFGSAVLHAQEGESRVLSAMVIGEDTIPVVTLRDFTIAEYRIQRSKRQQRQIDRLTRRVVKVYPYAKVAGDLMNEYDRQLSTLKTEKERKEYLKIAEEELKQEFEGEITNMTVTEGLILIKLIDRETGDTSFELIKELKGSFNAFMWQTVARLFGSNLKQEYDREGDDKMIEEIVQMIEDGEIYAPRRVAKTPEAKARLKNKKRS